MLWVQSPYWFVDVEFEALGCWQLHAKSCSDAALPASNCSRQDLPALHVLKRLLP